jgi:diguanylate cyclase (GGDEF)-like protein
MTDTDGPDPAIEAAADPATEHATGPPTQPVDGPAPQPDVAPEDAPGDEPRDGAVDGPAAGAAGPSRHVPALSTADRRYRMFVENMRDGAATMSPSGLILYANRRLAELLVRSRDTIVGSPLARFVAGDAALDADELRGVDGRGRTVELDLVDSDGLPVPVLLGASPLDIDGDRLTCLTFTDLSVQKAQGRMIAERGAAQRQRMAALQQAQSALTEQATHDALTGLANRALLVERIDRALVQARRSGSNTAVLFIDLDRFKQINDTRGHAVGDIVLRRVSEQLVGTMRSMDTVARIGGDEFVVLAPDVDSLVHAIDIGTRVLTALCRTDLAEHGTFVAASIGISISDAGRGDAETLLEEADLAMYEAKSLGGRRVEVFDAVLRQQVQQRAAAQATLQSAIDDLRIVAHYQPIIDLPNQAVVGFEALARITMHDGSVLGPAEFIPAAEENGLVVPLGTQMLAIACRAARSWQPTGSEDERLTVSVNLSSRQFEPGDLPTIIRTTLAQAGLDARCLQLELTETTIIELRPDILRQLHEIRDLGVELGLDDFGTGYASLTHLRRLPLTFVKIDPSFVHGLDHDDGDQRIVAAVIDLAANLGLRSIAEGVETMEQLERLRNLGCDQVQGYLLAGPRPHSEVAPTTSFADRR